MVLSPRRRNFPRHIVTRASRGERMVDHTRAAAAIEFTEPSHDVDPDESPGA
jgi:hypothetical protein